MGKRGFKAAKEIRTDHAGSRSTTTPFLFTSSWQLWAPNFRLLRRNLSTAIIIVLLPALLMQLGLMLIKGATVPTPKVMTGLSIVFTAVIWQVLNVSAQYYFQLRTIGGDQPGALECYRRSWHYLPRVIGLGLVNGLAIALGLVRLIKPGVKLFNRLFLSPYFLIDENLGIREAMDRSSTASEPAASYIWSTIWIMVAFIIAISLIGQLVPEYGGTLSSLLLIVYIFIPALRYKEVGRREHAADSLDIN